MKKVEIYSISFLLLFCVSIISGCNDDDERFSSSQISQALFDMKGTYHGTVQVAYYHGSDIVELENATAVSRDSLSFTMSLLPMAETIKDDNIARILRGAEKVTVTAGYKFIQMDEGSFNFLLYPKDIIIPCLPLTIKIVFSQTFGGNAESYSNFIMFNISPSELWINGEKYEEFKQLVYHFRGVYE